MFMSVFINPLVYVDRTLILNVVKQIFYEAQAANFLAK